MASPEHQSTRTASILGLMAPNAPPLLVTLRSINQRICPGTTQPRPGLQHTERCTLLQKLQTSRDINPACKSIGRPEVCDAFHPMGFQLQARRLRRYHVRWQCHVHVRCPAAASSLLPLSLLLELSSGVCVFKVEHGVHDWLASSFCNVIFFTTYTYYHYRRGAQRHTR